MADTVVLETLFGCVVRDLTAQFGINQNPTVLTATAVRDDTVGQEFSLATLPKHGARHLERVRFGKLDMWGIIQSWDEQKVNVAGTGVYTVRLTDTKPVLDCVEVLLGAPYDLTLGENIIGVVPEMVDDNDSGIRYSLIKAAVESRVIAYGEERYLVSLSNLPIGDRFVNGVRIPYRIPCGSLTILSLVQQIADDHGFDWFVETRQTKSGIYSIVIKPLLRRIATLDMQGLAAQHPNSVIRLAEGHEVRDEVVRTVVIGPNRQILSEEPGINWRPFWGFDDAGEVLTSPKFKIIDGNSTARWRSTTFAEMEQALNDEIKPLPSGVPSTSGFLPNDELNALRAYADEYWGRQFFAEINWNLIDASGYPWIDVTAGAWWEKAGNPDYLPKDGELKFQTDDGRWTCFVRMPDPAIVGGRWDDSVRYSDNVVTSQGVVHWYIKASVELVPIGRVANRVFNKRSAVYVLTLPNPMAVVTNRKNMGVAHGNSVQNLIYVIDLRGDEVHQGYMDSMSQVHHTFWEGWDGYSPVSPNQIVPSTGSYTPLDTGTGETSTTTTTRLSSLEKVFIPVLDRRQVYGPWTSDDIVPPDLRVPGKSRVTVDTSLTPWMFGFRGVSNPVEYTVAQTNFNTVARAKVRATTNMLTELDTGELEAAGLPAVNLGTEIGRGTNVTSIVCVKSVQGIRTTYKCNLYTNELGRFQRAYQDLVDKLRRDNRLRLNTLYPQADYRVISQAVKMAKKSLPVERHQSEKAAVQNPNLTVRILTRYTGGPNYKVEVYRQRKSWTEPFRLQDPTPEEELERRMEATGQVMNVWNQSEPDGKEGRLYQGLFVTCRRAEEKGVVSEYYVMHESPPSPNSANCTVVRYVGLDSTGYPVYQLALRDGNTKPLHADEINRLGHAINRGERKGSPGRIRVGSEVTVEWVEQADGSYYPIFNQEEGGPPDPIVATVKTGVSGTGTYPTYKVEPSGSTARLFKDELERLNEVPNRGERNYKNPYTPAETFVLVNWQRMVDGQGNVTYHPYFDKALNIFVAPGEA